ncbi:MAG: hypothetical protein ACKUBY_01830 [Candidatus Moraniibacteriota bacterium]|jgi:hypothetical protein
MVGQKNFGEIDFIMDESACKKNQITAVALVVADTNLIKNIIRIKEKMMLNEDDDVIEKINYHFSEDSKSIQTKLLEHISNTDIQAYLCIKTQSNNFENKSIYENISLGFLSPIVRRYEKSGYEKINLKVENFSDKIESDKIWMRDLLMKDEFLKEKITENFLNIEIIKKENELSFLPDYILGGVLCFVKENENKDAGSLVRTNLDKIKKNISMVRVVHEKATTKWYDFKKKSDYIVFIEEM